MSIHVATAVSDDIKAVVEWELANGNAVDAVHYPFGVPVVAMARPVRRWLGGAVRDVPQSLTWWEYRDAHDAELEWCAGFESSVTGHKVCGPLR